MRSFEVVRSLLCGGYLSLLRSLFQRSRSPHGLRPFDRLRAGYGLHSIAASRLDNSLDSAQGLKPSSSFSLRGPEGPLFHGCAMVRGRPFFVVRSSGVVSLPLRDRSSFLGLAQVVIAISLTRAGFESRRARSCTKEIGLACGALATGAEAQIFSFRYAALKGRSSTVVRSFEVIPVLCCAGIRGRPFFVVRGLSFAPTELIPEESFHPRLAPLDRLRAGCGLHSIAASRLDNSLDSAQGLKPSSVRFRYAALKGRSSTVVRWFEVVLVRLCDRSGSSWFLVVECFEAIGRWRTSNDPYVHLATEGVGRGLDDGFGTRGRDVRGLSFAPAELVPYEGFSPTACAVGCILSPLRGSSTVVRSFEVVLVLRCVIGRGHPRYCL